MKCPIITDAGGGYSSNRIRNIICVVISVVLAAALALMLYSYHVRQEEQAAYYMEMNKQRLEEEKAEEALRLEDIASSSFYEKLAKGYDVNVLIVGDSIGAGSGASADNYKWANIVSSYITETYGSSVILTNVSMGGNSSYAGYSRVMMMDDGIDYDLAIICYGQNDSKENFSMYYESIITAIGSRWTDCSIISVLESSQRDYTEKIKTIQSICDYYSIPEADTIAPFRENYDSLVSGGVHPNDEGYAIYAQCVEEVISELVESGEGKPDYNLPPINPNVASFANFRYIAAEEFERTSDTAFTITGLSVSGVFGIDYSYQSGENITEIYVDDELFIAPTVSFNYDFSQRHILIVSDECIVGEKIKIVFSNKEQADTFNGLIFSWE